MLRRKINILLITRNQCYGMSSIGPILEYYEGDDLHIVDANKDRSLVRAEIDRLLGR